MKRNQLLILLAGLCLIGIAAAPKLTTAWINEDMKRHDEWRYAAHVKTYGMTAIYGYRPYEFFLESGVASNHIRVELGFRSDGTVVWRKAE